MAFKKEAAMSRGTHQKVDFLSRMRRALGSIFPPETVSTTAANMEAKPLSRTRKLSQPGSTGEIILTVEETLDERSY
ncbi:hypothetical protein HY627_01320 [Candidatus Uhrbacteria bacterium]|nr:hypothetical protein [Candidatus Uhrbacteria bacterium]